VFKLKSSRCRELSTFSDTFFKLENIRINCAITGTLYQLKRNHVFMLFFILMATEKINDATKTTPQITFFIISDF